MHNDPADNDDDAILPALHGLPDAVADTSRPYHRDCGVTPRTLNGVGHAADSPAPIPPPKGCTLAPLSVPCFLSEFDQPTRHSA